MDLEIWGIIETISSILSSGMKRKQIFSNSHETHLCVVAVPISSDRGRSTEIKHGYLVVFVADREGMVREAIGRCDEERRFCNVQCVDVITLLQIEGEMDRKQTVLHQVCQACFARSI